MKIHSIRIWTLGLGIGFLYGTQLSAQNTEIKVQKYTLIERFEPNFVVSMEDRIQLKKGRIAETSRTKELLDSLHISKRKRRKLLKDLRLSPFSNRLAKVIAEAKFEGVEE
ncbi:MAG: hypothetical protein QM485_15095 [Flavobacteriaceae bacterium]